MGSWGRAVGQKDNVERVGDGTRPSQMPYNSIYDTLATFEINLPPLNLLARVQGLKRRWRAVGQKTTWNGADMARDRQRCLIIVCMTRLPRLEEVCHV